MTLMSIGAFFMFNVHLPSFCGKMIVNESKMPLEAGFLFSVCDVIVGGRGGGEARRLQ